MNPKWQRPNSAAEVCEGVRDTEAFGRNLRDWQHELKKIHNRAEFSRRVAAPPRLLAGTLRDHGQCDAWLAAYVEWLCNRIGLDSPAWTEDPRRIARKAWYDHPALWRRNFVEAPGPFRRRGIFTRPENVITLKPGRPQVDATHKRDKNAERQRRYRRRVRQKMERLAQLESQRTAI